MSGNKLKIYLSEKATNAFSTSSYTKRRQRKTASLEQIARETINQTYCEEDPSVTEWFQGLVPSSSGVAEYVSELFPSAQWVRRYNLHWLAGDLIAGTFPMPLMFAIVLNVSRHYGRPRCCTTGYGVCRPCWSATCFWSLHYVHRSLHLLDLWDIKRYCHRCTYDPGRLCCCTQPVGSRLTGSQTTAVGSLLVGSVISKVEAEHPGAYRAEHIAHALTFLAGAVIFAMGILRFGWIIEFIPYVPISAFVTSAAFTIISTQLPAVLGIRGIKTREAPYKVYVNTLKGLPIARLDAAIGITCILLLHITKSACAKMESRQPSRKRVWSLLSSLRLTFAILLYTLISYLLNRKALPKQEKFKIVGHIDKGK